MIRKDFSKMDSLARRRELHVNLLNKDWRGSLTFPPGDKYPVFIELSRTNLYTRRITRLLPTLSVTSYIMLPTLSLTNPHVRPCTWPIFVNAPTPKQDIHRADISQLSTFKT